MKTCLIDGCANKVHAKEMCKTHYNRSLRGFDVNAPIKTMRKKERHGMRYSPEYVLWVEMKGRCERKSHPEYSNYGGRGIVMCRRWSDSFTAFLEDVGLRPDPKLTIDRVDNNRGYEPGNVRWATMQQQANNTRRNRLVESNGVTHTLSEWARLLNVDKNWLRYQTVCLGRPIERLLKGETK